jgi:geranylgeranyl diphosphate synthase type II
MDPSVRVERALAAALARCELEGAPPKLAAGIRHAVMPGGARIRPRICLAVGMACGEDEPRLSEAAACAVELLHCASLVHDDMPCFDNAATRRGRPSVHTAFGERIALLAGDALIVMAFDTLARAAAARPERIPNLLLALTRGVGMPCGIVAGQAWECETRVSLSNYQMAKTGALFVAAAQCGALASGGDPGPWASFGSSLGEAYQVADDIRDVVASSLELGKPAGQDLLLGRPSAAEELGLQGAAERFHELVDRAKSSVPQCRNRNTLRALIEMEALRLLPKELALRVA